MFYTFNQNNSGGQFVHDPGLGISHYVIIEANSESEAINRAVSTGLYFNSSGDCGCCGPRWSDYYPEPSDQPMVYDSNPFEVSFDDSGSFLKWINGPEGYVHYLDSRIIPFWE